LNAITPATFQRNKQRSDQFRPTVSYQRVNLEIGEMRVDLMALTSMSKRTLNLLEPMGTLNLREWTMQESSSK